MIAGAIQMAVSLFARESFAEGDVRTERKHDDFPARMNWKLAKLFFTLTKTRLCRPLWAYAYETDKN